MPRRLLLLAGFLALALALPAQTAKPPFYKDKSNLLYYLDDKGKSVAVKSSADWRKRRDHVLANAQLVMGEMPPDSRKVALDVKVESEETLARVVRKKIT